MSKPIIVFSPNYMYLNLPVFLPVMSRLTEMGMDTILLTLPGNLQLQEAPSGSILHKHSYRTLPLKLEPKYEKSITRKVVLLIKLVWNCRLIYSFIRNERPNAIVVGSDLGNVHIRFLMEACLEYHIPVFVLYNCDVPESLDSLKPKYPYLWVQRVSRRIGRFIFLRAVFFQDHIPGKYHPEAVICVLSEAVRGKLIEKGIQPARIIATGMPVDETHTVKKEVLLAHLKIPAHSLIITFFSGPMSEVFGAEREKIVLGTLQRMVDDLPEDVFFIVKVHPRETPDEEAMLHQMFSSKRCRITKSIAAEDMIQHVDLVVGNFSRILITAAAKGKRFLCINPWDDPRSLLNRTEANILEINDLENLTSRVQMALYDPVYQLKMDAACRAMAGRYSVNNETDPALTITSLICRNMGGSI